MKAIRAGVIAALISCAPAAGEPPIAPSPTIVALKASELACMFLSRETDSRKLGQICGVLPSVIPVAVPLIEALIGQRDGLSESGARWTSVRSTSDGGAIARDAGHDTSP